MYCTFEWVMDLKGAVNANHLVSTNQTNLKIKLFYTRKAYTPLPTAYRYLEAKIYIFYSEEPKVGLKTMKTYTNRIEPVSVFPASLILQQNRTPFALVCIAEIHYRQNST